VVVGVEAQEPTVAGANADVTTRMKKVLAALEKAGVAAKDIRTLRYNVDVQRSFQGTERRHVIATAV